MEIIAVDGDFNDLTITCDKGIFSDNGNTWTATGTGFS